MLIIGERILLTLWIGGMWIIGYVVVPPLFSMLEDNKLAGNIAGQLFTTLNYIGLVAAALLLAGQYVRHAQASFKNRLFWVIVIMLVITLISQFILHPMMAELKTQEMTDAIKGQFGRVHLFSSLLYMANSVFGLVLVAFSNKFIKD